MARVLATGTAPVSAAHLLVPITGPEPGTLSPLDLAERIASAREDPALAALVAAAESLVARQDGHIIAAIGIISLDATQDSDDVYQAQLAAEDVVAAVALDGFDARTFSSAKMSQEIDASQGTTTQTLMVGALVVIVVILVVFYRTLADVLTTLSGLVLTIVWVFGIQGLLGPGGVGLIGANNPLATMIPVLLISLTVDYALQFTTRYRELLGQGAPPKTAVSQGIQESGMPLLLASLTTAISFLTNIISPLAPMRDFGIIAAVGVMCGWFVMTTFVPSVRTLIDRRRARKGKPLQRRLMADAIPGVAPMLKGLARVITRQPLLILAGVAVVSGIAFWGATTLSTTFDETDFLPEDTESYEDIVFLSEHFAGASGSAITILVEGDFTDLRVLTVLSFIEQDLNTEAARPAGITGPVSRSLFSLIEDWADDSGLPGDKYDSDFEAFVAALQSEQAALSPDDILEMYARLESVDPAGFSAVAALDAQGQGLSILSVPIDPAMAESLIRSLDVLGAPLESFGASFTPTGPDLIAVVITEEMTEGQLRSIVVTIAAALVVLGAFFMVTERHAVLGLITVLPIILVVGWVLGSMALLGISYNVLTALITALTIGVGVDYTIHIAHRFLEDHAKGQGIRRSVESALRTTGGALIGSALTTALGFAVLVFSPLAPMRQFGGLTALTILYSLGAAFVVLPPMLVLWALAVEWRIQHRAEKPSPSPRGAVFRLGGHLAVNGRTVACPACHTRTFVPTAVKALRCPNLTCEFSGPVPETTRQ